MTAADEWKLLLDLVSREFWLVFQDSRRYLFLGHAESLIGRRTDFQPARLCDSIVYRRPGPGS